MGNCWEVKYESFHHLMKMKIWIFGAGIEEKYLLTRKVFQKRKKKISEIILQTFSPDEFWILIFPPFFPPKFLGNFSFC